MTDIAIRAEHLSKQYRIGRKELHLRRNLREAVGDTLVSPFRRIADLYRGTSREQADETTIWALKDVSFEIRQGEILGIIGRNGAGKSTLLKVLSRITEPSSGFAEIHGRIAALLEVGTGFHPELTGRENVYLNGTILGMRQREIDRKFDEIVDFSGVERFIDTPVKHYSSGMHLRLAFSVAAHLEPEIVLVDEVLAVGDAAFQRKCLGKMDDVASQGRTVIFVSHNLAVVKELCESSIVLSDGCVATAGTVVEGLACYSKMLLANELEGPAQGKRWYGTRVNEQVGELATTLRTGEPFRAEAWLNLEGDHTEVKLICLVYDAVGNLVLHRSASLDGTLPSTLRAGQYRVRVEVPPLWLAPGVYTLYFKFLGLDGALARQKENSDGVILELLGDAREISRALTAPPVTWELTGAEDHEASLARAR